MSGFNAEHPFFVHTLVATAALTAGDPVTGAGAKATGADDFAGVAMSDAAIGEHVPVCSHGVLNVQLDAAASGVSPGDPVTYDSDGYDIAGVLPGFAQALDTAVAAGYARILIMAMPGAVGAALTAIDATVIDATYNADEEGVLNNVRTRLNELEARLIAAGLIA